LEGIVNEKERFLKNVWPRVTEFLNEKGPANYSGFIAGIEQGWRGPYIWSENGDLVRLITRYCEDEFGFPSVHNECKIDKFMFLSYNPKLEKTRKSIDIDITNAEECEDWVLDPNDPRKDKGYIKFRKLQHTLFIEVKHIFKGAIRKDPAKKIQGFVEDCKRLQEEIRNKRCKYAIAIIIDDGDRKGNNYIQDAPGLIASMKNVNKDVEPLIWQRQVKDRPSIR